MRHGAAHGVIHGNGDSSPFVEIDRADWAELAPSTPLPLKETEIVQLRGLGDPLDMREVAEVYLPLSRLLNLYVAGAQAAAPGDERVPAASAPRARPFVIGVAGSVAVGKSTIARLLRELLVPLGRHPARRAGHHRRVPAARTPSSSAAACMERKGFPESYDRRALLRFVTAVKSGAAEVRAPFYSHLSYDIVPGCARSWCAGPTS